MTKGISDWNLQPAIFQMKMTHPALKYTRSNTTVRRDPPSSESQSCWDDGSEGRARALYSNTTELEMIWLLMATCSVTRPVSWAGQGQEKSVKMDRKSVIPLHYLLVAIGSISTFYQLLSSKNRISGSNCIAKWKINWVFKFRFWSIIFSLFMFTSE